MSVAVNQIYKITTGERTMYRKVVKVTATEAHCVSSLDQKSWTDKPSAVPLTGWTGELVGKGRAPRTAKPESEGGLDIQALIEKVVRKVVKEELASIRKDVDSSLDQIPAIVDKRIKQIFKN